MFYLACSPRGLAVTQVGNRNSSLVCLSLWMRVPLEGTIQHITIGSCICIGSPCYTVIFFNTTLSALSHRPQLTSDTISHYSLTFTVLVLSAATCAAAGRPDKSQGGHCVILQTPASPFIPLAHHFLRFLCYTSNIPSSSSCLPSRGFFHSERLSCDLLYIFSIKTAFIFLCLFHYSYIWYIFE